MQSKETSTIRLRGIRKVYRIGGEMLAALDGIDLDIRRGSSQRSWDPPARENPRS